MPYDHNLITNIQKKKIKWKQIVTMVTIVFSLFFSLFGFCVYFMFSFQNLKWIVSIWKIIINRSIIMVYHKQEFFPFSNLNTNKVCLLMRNDPFQWWMDHLFFFVVVETIMKWCNRNNNKKNIQSFFFIYFFYNSFRLSWLFFGKLYFISQIDFLK